MDGALPDADRIMQIIENKARKRRGQRFGIVTADGHRKLIATHTGQHAILRHVVAQRTRNDDDQLIAYLVPVDIIDVFKAVEVDKDHAFTIGIPAQAHPLQLFNQRPAVR